VISQPFRVDLVRGINVVRYILAEQALGYMHSMLIMVLQILIVVTVLL
jgi:hypothetical protein